MQKTIESRLRDHFPILFNRANSVDHKEYRKEFKTFIDDAISISNPILSPEAIRYQSILLYVSLVYAALHFLDIKQLKIVDIEIVVSHKLFAVYAVFIGLVSLAFYFKAKLDYKRWSLIRRKHSEAAGTLQELVALGLIRKQIEHHYWNKTYHLIDVCQESYGAALEKVLTNYKALDLKTTMSFEMVPIPSNHDLAPVITAKEAWLNDLQTELNTLNQAFQSECEAIFIAHEAFKQNASPFQIDDSYDRVNAAYRKWLEPWVIARNSMVDEMFSQTLKKFGSSVEQELLEELNAIFVQLKNARVTYVTAEIILPIAFAILVPVYVMWMG